MPETDLTLAKVVEPREDSGGVSYSLQSTAYSLSAGEARAGVGARAALALWLGAPLLGLIRAWSLAHGDSAPLTRGLAATACAVAVLLPVLLALRCGLRPRRAVALASPGLALAAVVAVTAGWYVGEAPGAPHYLVCGLAGALALMQAALLALCRDVARPAGLLLLAPALLAWASGETALKAVWSAYPFLGDSIYFETRAEPGVLNWQGAPDTLYRGKMPGQGRTGRLRVLVLGGSVVYGLGVDEGDDYPSVLEHSLARLGLEPVEVFNGGIPSFTSELGLELFRGRLPEVAPDLLLLSYGSNDFDNDEVKGPGLDRVFLQKQRWLKAHPAAKAARDAMRNSGLYLLLRWFLLQSSTQMYPGGIPAPAPGKGPRVTPEQFEGNLAEFTRLAREQGTLVAVTMDVHQVDAERACADGTADWVTTPARHARKAARELDVPWLDARPAFCRSGRPLPELWLDGQHLSVAGCRIMGEELARQLVDGGVLTKGDRRTARPPSR
jgi:lysophospholipase L1-like esterase